MSKYIERDRYMYVVSFLNFLDIKFCSLSLAVVRVLKRNIPLKAKM